MKIRITKTLPLLSPDCGLSVGSVHDAIPNSRWKKGAPRWFVDGVGQYTPDGIGIFEDEAEEIPDETDYEDEEAQNTEVPVLQAENATGMVEGRSGDHNPLDVQLLSAQPARKTEEDTP